MYTKRNYGFWLTFNWSKMPFLYGMLYSGVVFALFFYFKTQFAIDLSIPWQPISVLGIAVAFYLGFKNNASYDRTWEARKIWGGIVNNSRSFGAAVTSFIQGPQADTIHKQLVYRHIAWLTALRYQLRVTREWEHSRGLVTGSFYPQVTDQYFENLEKELLVFLTKEEVSACLKKANIATQLLKNQSVALQEFRNQGLYDDFRHMELHKLIATFYDDQGRSERIKNFPFPRQYASAALWQLMIFSALIPFGMLSIFTDWHQGMSFVVVPFSALIIWSFFLMEKIGDYSENPFEGSYNDIPITSISRAIEIDLRQMIDDTAIPEVLKSSNGFLM